MAATLDAWQKEVGATFPSRNPGYSESEYVKAMAALETTGVPRREKEHAAPLCPDYGPRGGWWDQRGKSTKPKAKGKAKAK